MKGFVRWKRGKNCFVNLRFQKTRRVDSSVMHEAGWVYCHHFPGVSSYYTDFLSSAWYDVVRDGMVLVQI